MILAHNHRHDRVFRWFFSIVGADNAQDHTKIKCQRRVVFSISPSTAVIAGGSRTMLNALPQILVI